MKYEYKAIGAPEKGKRKRGARSASDKVAAAFEEILGKEAVDGWEYLRTDLLPVNERAGMFSRAQEMHRAVMVFRRALEQEPELRLAPAAATTPAPAPLAAPTPIRSVRETPPLRTAPPSAAPAKPELTLELGKDPDVQIADIVRGSENKSGD